MLYIVVDGREIPFHLLHLENEKTIKKTLNGRQIFIEREPEREPEIPTSNLTMNERLILDCIVNKLIPQREDVFYSYPELRSGAKYVFTLREIYEALGWKRTRIFRWIRMLSERGILTRVNPNDRGRGHEIKIRYNPHV